MTDTQGSPSSAESNVQNGQGSPNAESAGVLPSEVPQQFVVESPNATPAVPEGQGESQGQNQQQTAAVVPDLAKHYQSIADQRQAEIYRLQQELQLKQTAQPQQGITENNPYDPQTDWWNALKWEQNRAAKEAAKSAAEQAMSGVLNFAKQQATLQQEMQWQQAHPNVDINLVKQWGQMNGVNSLDHAYTLMTLPNTIQSAQTQAANTAFNSFRQPQNVATPVRGGQQAGGTVQLSYEAMAKEYQESFGKAYETWSPALQKAFNQETARRADAGRTR